MAWLTGYIYADGCITGEWNDRLQFCCKLSDIELLNSIKELLGGAQEVLKSSILDHRTDKRYESCHLTICSYKIVKDLVELHGLRPRKSKLDLAFPEVPDEYLSHFVRGYFDGDGCAYNDGKGHLRLYFYGHGSFLLTLKEKLIRCLDIGNSSVCHHSKYQSVITWSSSRDVARIYDWLYGDVGEICLERKRNLIENFLGVCSV